MRIGIVNYNLGNVGSVYSAFSFYKSDVRLISDPKELETSDLIVLAGVGNFKTAVGRLKSLGFWDVLNEEVISRKKPVLGICLGMQLFADVSHESGNYMGFGWIRGQVIKMEGESIRVPHIGWNEVSPVDGELFRGMRSNFFYFMHSYHFVPEEKEVVIATTGYGNLEIVSAIRKENIMGVQFHPEKSQGDGLRLIRNILELVDDTQKNSTNVLVKRTKVS